MNRKKRVLLVGEYAASGFGEYTRQLCSRLSKIYDFACLECYAVPFCDDNYVENWRYYPNAIQKDHPKFANYNSNKQNQFGAWNFESVLLDFYPDIVLDFRDPSFFIFERLSPLRKYFAWIISPTVDSSPQMLEWLDMFQSADRVLTYSDYGYNILKKECPNISLFKPAYMGVNHNIFQPLDKDLVRKKYEIPSDWLICSFVARNQKRKLFLDLIDCFKLIRKKDKELFNKLYFHFHTSIIDLSPFNIPYWLLESGLSHKILFTYLCTECRNVSVNFYKGAISICKFCGKNSATVPTVANSTSQQQLAELYNISDSYVQYASCEGFGTPLAEAMSCGIPSFGTDYSAISDLIRLGKGYPIKVQRLFYDLELNARRALPDNNDFVEQLTKFLKLPKQIREKIGFQSHLAAREHFDWDKNAQIWMEAIESLDLDKCRIDWDAPFPDLQPKFDIPKNLNVKDFVFWCIDNIWLESEFKNTYFILNTIRNIEHGAVPEGGELKPYTAERFIELSKNRINAKIFWERVRCGLEMIEESEAIKYSRIKEMSN